MLYFESEDIEDAYIYIYIFLKFSHLKRHCDISMNDYIIEFEKSFNGKSKYEITRQSSCLQIIRRSNDLRKSATAAVDVS